VRIESFDIGPIDRGLAVQRVKGGLHTSSFFHENRRSGVGPPAGWEDGVANGDPVDCGKDRANSERWESAVRFAS
jgi:hypothetical protein